MRRHPTFQLVKSRQVRWQFCSSHHNSCWTIFHLSQLNSFFMLLIFLCLNLLGNLLLHMLDYMSGQEFLLQLRNLLALLVNQLKQVLLHH